MNETKNSQVVLSGAGGKCLIRKTPGVCGGDACIRSTRIMVWLLVDLKHQGASDQEILEGYPTLTPEDLQAAWEYYRQHPQEIDDAIAGQEDED
ncbi:MAG TPA: DUF433 domain-containing protein [Gemmataceae bacterium]|nr:DUF433 domain-containing protein [Gemmataceae bacterium]